MTTPRHPIRPDPTILTILLLILNTKLAASQSTTEPSQTVITKTTETQDANLPQDNIPENSAQTQSQFAAINITQITTNSAHIAWAINNKDILSNITQLHLNITSVAGDKIVDEFLSKDENERKVENLDFSTRYKVCIQGRIGFGRDPVADQPSCEEFTTRYDPLNRRALGALACAALIALMFVVFLGLDFALGPVQPSSERLKKYKLELQDERKAQRRMTRGSVIEFEDGILQETFVKE